LAAASLLAAPGLLEAQPAAHYVPGVEGIKGSSLPPPGLYFRDYNAFYIAGQVNDAAGNAAVLPSDFKAIVYANVPRLIWITDAKVLGGNVGVDALLPLEYQSQRFSLTPGAHVPLYDHHSFGIGDFFAEGTLSWHPQQFDFAVGAGSWMPTGDSAKGPTTRAGLGYWTPMLTAGVTWYIDSDKTWAISALSRYEINTKDRDTHDTVGQVYTMEWGVSKTLAKIFDVGAVGYYQQKVSRDTGNYPAYLSPYNRVAAVGPEVSVVIPSAKMFLSLRYEYEFMAESRAQGDTVCLTLTKAL
jgi:hypothetical protein